MAEIGTDIKKAIGFLQKGGLVAIPTETVYGLAANALDERAVTRIFKAKGRPAYNPLILHIGDMDRLKDWVREVPDPAIKLMDAFWPGPLTLILPRRESISNRVTSGLSTVGVRMPAHPLTLELLKSLSFPLAAPSANPFGYISPTTAKHVDQQLGDVIPYILDGGPCGHGLESTIVGFNHGKPVLYRYGAITKDQIQDVLQSNLTISTKSSDHPTGPGMLPYHYSPHARLVVVKNIHDYDITDIEKTGVITFSKPIRILPEKQQIILSQAGDLHEAGRKLYDALRHMDQCHYDLILVERMPEAGLGLTINDRLERAAAK